MAAPLAKSFASGTTAGVALEAQACTLNALTINAAATSVVTIYDNASAASGTILFQKTFAAATMYQFPANQGHALQEIGGIKAANGLFLVVATAAAEVTAYVS